MLKYLIKTTKTPDDDTANDDDNDIVVRIWVHILIALNISEVDT
jgi:hypothetical protein